MAAAGTRHTAAAGSRRNPTASTTVADRNQNSDLRQIDCRIAASRIDCTAFTDAAAHSTAADFAGRLGRRLGSLTGHC